MKAHKEQIRKKREALAAAQAAQVKAAEPAPASPVQATPKSKEERRQEVNELKCVHLN
jgi:hypothetical protein